MNRMLVRLLLLLIALSGCDSTEVDDPAYAYPTPELLTPDRAEFFSTEEVRFGWRLAQGITGSDHTILFLPGFFDPTLHQVIFDTTGTTSGFRTSPGAEPQQEIVYHPNPDAPKEVFISYRIRSAGPEGTSDWTEVRSLVIRPVSRMDRVVVTFDVEFDFESRESDGYYSATTLSSTVDFDRLLRDAGRDPARARVARPTQMLLSYEGSNYLDFDRVVLGFHGTVDRSGDYPFDPITGGYGMPMPQAMAQLSLSPYGGRFLNVIGGLRQPEPRIEMAYFLSSRAQPGTMHRARLQIELEVFSE
jgi:hypothetical protein